MDKVRIARGAAFKLAEAEAAIDLAIAKTCRLIEGLVTARSELRVSTTVGGASGERLAASLAALMQARAEMAAAHEGLSDVQARLGLGATNLSADFTGPLDKPPPRSGRLVAEGPDASAEVRPLRRV